MSNPPNEQRVFDALCRTNLDAFTCKAINVIEPGVQLQYNWHMGCVAEHLTAVWNKELQNLIINISPRWTKTLGTSVCFPAWGFGQDPSIKFMLTSFKASLAEKMTRRTRMIMRSEWYRRTFQTRISEELDRQYYFETTNGGQYFSSSMASATGEGCDIQISDDPLSPDEALSDTVRESTLETMKGTLFSRFNDPRTGRFILVMQRLHDGDPTGEFLKEQGWTHLKIPAETKSAPLFIKLGNREWKVGPNELIFPQRFNREVLDKARERLGEYNYAGQYLQSPIPLGGGMLKPEWIQFYNPGAIKPKEMNIYILVDPAGGDEDEKKKKDKNSDWTAFVVVGVSSDNNYYLLDIVRDRLNPTERIDTLFMLHKKWNDLAGKAAKVGYEKYSMQSDTHYITERKKLDVYNFPLIVVAGPKQKTTRVSRLIPDMENGRWYFPQSLVYVDIEGRSWDLVRELLNSEMMTFPRSKHDDMLDALSRIYEPELNVVFPKQKTNNMVGKAYKGQRASSQAWQDM